jgi:hypothetical protein
MVRTVPTGRGPGSVEVSPDACPNPQCGRRPMWPYWTSCDSQDEPGHRYWKCAAAGGCGLVLIDADCDCTTSGRRWPDHAATGPDVADS